MKRFPAFNITVQKLLGFICSIPEIHWLFQGTEEITDAEHTVKFTMLCVDGFNFHEKLAYGPYGRAYRKSVEASSVIGFIGRSWWPKAYIFTGEALDAVGAVEDAMKLSVARDRPTKRITTFAPREPNFKITKASFAEPPRQSSARFLLKQNNGANFKPPLHLSIKLCLYSKLIIAAKPVYRALYFFFHPVPVTPPSQSLEAMMILLRINLLCLFRR
jgi:hypothetical protein